MPEINLHCPLNVVDVSSDQRVAAAGSTNSLLLFRIGSGVDTLSLEETHVIRDNSRMSSLKPILDLRFNPTLALPHLLATTSSSGALVVWDITHCKTSLGHWEPSNVLAGHTGSVNCVTWHYSNPHTLISGSHDFKVKLWDLRVRTGATLSLCPAKGCAVRAVQFRKCENANRFAVALTNGTVQIWDIRHAKVAERTFKAHDIAYTLDWNPDLPDLLLSGGREGIVKVWDTSLVGESDRQVKPAYSIQTSDGPVIKAKWRPGHPYQLGTSSGRSTDINIWSVLDSDVPLACMDVGGEAVGTGFVWLDQHLKQDDVIGSSLCGTHWWDWDDENTEAFEPDDDLRMLVQKNTLFHPGESVIMDGSVAGSSVAVFDEMSLDRKKDLQRQRFRCFKHRHRSGHEKKAAFGMILGCTRAGFMSIRNINSAMKPVEKFRPNAISFSFTGKIACTSSADRVSRNENELSNYRIYPDNNGAVPPTPYFSCCETRGDEVSSGFVYSKFIEFAKRYITPKTDDKLVHSIEQCCVHNANLCDQLQNPEVSQIWRLLQSLFTKTEEEEEEDDDDDDSNCFNMSASSSRASGSPRKTFSRKNSFDSRIARSHRVMSPRNRKRTRSSHHDSAASEVKDLKDDRSELESDVQSMAESDCDMSSDIKGVLVDISGDELKDPYQSDTTLGMWEAQSLNLLYRLSLLAPLKSDFHLKAPLLDIDKQELGQALHLAKPLESPVRPGIYGEHKRKQAKEKRRDMAFKATCAMFSNNQEAVIPRSEESLSLKVYPSAEFGPLATVGFRSSFVHSVLEFYSELGDVQLCAMIVMVLGEELQPPVNPNTTRKWLCSYIDLLQRAQQFASAARVISTCGNTQVEQCYQITSRIAQGCLTCSTSKKSKTKSIITINPYFKGRCEGCQSVVSRCAICQLAVRGVYVWCQGCGHGGHLDHLNKWFETESVCPSGCGHNCRMKMVN